VAHVSDRIEGLREAETAFRLASAGRVEHQETLDFLSGVRHNLKPETGPESFAHAERRNAPRTHTPGGGLRRCSWRNGLVDSRRAAAWDVRDHTGRYLASYGKSHRRG
jgi:hypothetical protein